MKTSEKIDKIYAAVFAVKKELVAVAKSADNPFFKSKYADLNTHLDEVEPRLEKVGCMLLQPINSDNTVESRIVHIESGQFISSEMPLIVAKNTMQDAGSAVTYARRYTLGALLSMKSEDDDGEKSMGRTPTKSVPSDVRISAAIEATTAKRSSFFRTPRTKASTTDATVPVIPTSTIASEVEGWS